MGLWENSPAGKHSLLFKEFLNQVEQCCQNGLLTKLFLQPLVTTGQQISTPDHFEAKASKNKPAIVTSVSSFISTMLCIQIFGFSETVSCSACSFLCLGVSV
jgi:hypothetical protein